MNPVVKRPVLAHCRLLRHKKRERGQAEVSVRIERGTGGLPIEVRLCLSKGAKREVVETRRDS